MEENRIKFTSARDMLRKIIAREDAEYVKVMSDSIAALFDFLFDVLDAGENSFYALEKLRAVNRAVERFSMESSARQVAINSLALVSFPEKFLRPFPETNIATVIDELESQLNA